MSLLSLPLRQLKKTVVFVIGVALLLLGFIMLFTVGPGTVMILAGLGVLAVEFIWARNLLKKAQSLVLRLKLRKKTDPPPCGQPGPGAPDGHNGT